MAAATDLYYTSGAQNPTWDSQRPGPLEKALDVEALVKRNLLLLIGRLSALLPLATGFAFGA